MFLLILWSYWSYVPTDTYYTYIPTDRVFLLIPCSYRSSVLMVWCQSGRHTRAMSHNPAFFFIVESWSESQSWDAGHWWSRPCFFLRLWKWFKGAFEVHITFILTTILHYLMPMIALDGTNSSLAPK